MIPTLFSSVHDVCTAFLKQIKLHILPPKHSFWFKCNVFAEGLQPWNDFLHSSWSIKVGAKKLYQSLPSSLSLLLQISTFSLSLFGISRDVQTTPKNVYPFIFWETTEVMSHVSHSFAGTYSSRIILLKRKAASHFHSSEAPAVRIMECIPCLYMLINVPPGTSSSGTVKVAPFCLLNQALPFVHNVMLSLPAVALRLTAVLIWVGK